MIYLKNNTEKQTIFIPRNELQKEAFITTIRTYEDGLKEGYGNGIEHQKDQLLNLYVTENGVYEREDGYGKVTVVVNEGGTDCKEAIETAYEDGYKEGYEDGAASTQIDLENKSIDIVSNGEYTVTPTDGFDALESVKISVDVPNEGKCNLEDKIIAPQTNEVDVYGYLYIKPNEGYDGLMEVALHTGNLKNDWFNEGYEEGKSQGGECNIQADKLLEPQLSEIEEGYLYVYPDEGYIGMSRTVIQTANLREGWYKEGYEQGKAEGGGECNLEDKIIAPETNEVDGNGYIYIRPNEGYDGIMEVALQTDHLKNGWYNEGYEQGKVEGGGGNCNLSHQLEVIETNGRHIFYPQNNGWDGYDFFEVEVDVPTTAKLQDVWVTPSMADRDGNNLLVYSPNTDEGYDGLSRVVIDPQTIYNEGVEKGFSEGKTEGYNDGYNEGKNEISTFTRTAVLFENGDITINDAYGLMDSQYRITKNYAIYQDIINSYLITKYSVGEGVSRIKGKVFDNAPNMSKLTLKGVMELDDNVFEGCQYLSEVYFDATLGRIGKGVFLNCAYLRTIKYYGTLSVDIADDAFYGVNNVTLYLREGVDETPWLKGHSNWKVERF